MPVYSLTIYLHHLSMRWPWGYPKRPSLRHQSECSHLIARLNVNAFHRWTAGIAIVQTCGWTCLNSEISWGRFPEIRKFSKVSNWNLFAWPWRQLEECDRNEKIDFCQTSSLSRGRRKRFRKLQKNNFWVQKNGVCTLHTIANSKHPGANPYLILNQFSHTCVFDF